MYINFANLRKTTGMPPLIAFLLSNTAFELQNKKAMIIPTPYIF